MLEHRHAPLLPRQKFYTRLGVYALISLGATAVSVAIGMIGYRYFENFGLVDSFANATMILSGMGPLDPIKTQGGRVFVGFYSLFSGVFLLTTIGFFLMPIIHRLLHKFHVEGSPSAKADPKTPEAKPPTAGPPVQM
jgi:hypothetical protein